MTQIQEVPPKHQQIRGYYARLIQTGELPPGGKLPSVRAIADQWDVAVNTAAAAIRLLTAEGLVKTSRGPAGTVVAEQDQAEVLPPRLMFGPQERLGWTEPVPGERSQVVQAGMVDASGAWAYVGGILNLEEVPRHRLTPVYLRRQVTYTPDGKPKRIESSWFDPRWAGEIPALASETEPVPSLGGVAWAISQHTGWPIIAGTHGVESRDPIPGDWEMPYLGVGPAAPLLAGVYRWDARMPQPDGGTRLVTLEYGEYCAGKGQVIEFRFGVTPPAEGETP